MMQNGIAILLSTYNGEKFLGEQIESIINQDYKDWTLYIRDDGSTDRTKEIVQQYVNNHSNIFFIDDDVKRGAAFGFLYLLDMVDSQYYMFCDQDDVWFSSKVSSLFSLIRGIENTSQKPLLVFSDSEVVDENLQLLSKSFWDYNKVHPKHLVSNRKLINVFNSTAGCTMLFNKEVKKKVIFRNENIKMHDWYLMILVLEFGEIAYLDCPLMYYRQHTKNVVGAKKIEISSLLKKLKKLNKTVDWQIDTFKFVKQFTKISIFNYYVLKILFIFKRFS